jgi:hypothetical protein
MKRTCAWMSAFVGSLLSLAVVSAARAEEPVVYTRVAQWQIARTNWDAYEQNLKTRFVPVMEKLMADGVILEFGADTTTVHSPDGYTHSTWFCAGSLANLEKALDTLVAAGSKLTPEERRKQDTDFAGAKHADLVLRSVQFRNRAVKTEKGYETVSAQKILPGKVQLYQDGAVTAYGVDAELVHTGDPGFRFFWQLVPDAAAMDKVQAAFDASREKHSPEERHAIGMAFNELRDQSAHRDSESQVLYYSAK